MRTGMAPAAAVGTFMAPPIEPGTSHPPLRNLIPIQRPREFPRRFRALLYVPCANRINWGSCDSCRKPKISITAST